jgi:hypothetical protein
MGRNHNATSIAFFPQGAAVNDTVLMERVPDGTAYGAHQGGRGAVGDPLSTGAATLCHAPSKWVDGWMCELKPSTLNNGDAGHSPGRG